MTDERDGTCSLMATLHDHPLVADGREQVQPPLRFVVCEEDHTLRRSAEESRQCTLTGSSSWLQALATADSRLSVITMGVPSAACSAKSCVPGSSSGASGSRRFTSSG